MADPTPTPAPTSKPQTESVRAAKKAPSISTQIYLRVAEIHDNVLVLKNGGVRAVLRCSSVNFNLKSEEEQNAIIYSYQSFLNTLDFPIQIIVRSKRLDIDNYLTKLRELAEKQTNPMLQKQTFDYAEYVQKLVEYANIMEKDFLVIVPYDPYRAQKVNLIQKVLQHLGPRDTYGEVKRRHEEFDQLRKGLSQRVNVVKSGLENVGLQIKQLETQELIELFYNIYNPVVSRSEKLKSLKELSIEREEGESTEG